MDIGTWWLLCGILSCTVHFGGCEVFSKTHLPVNAPVEQRSSVIDISPMDNEIPGINGQGNLPLKTTDNIGPADVSPIFIPKNSNLHDTKPSTSLFESMPNGTTAVPTSTTQAGNTTTPSPAMPYLINTFPLLNPLLYPSLPHQQVVTSLFPLSTQLAGSNAPGTPVINIWNVQISHPSGPPPNGWPHPGAAQQPNDATSINIVPGVPVPHQQPVPEVGQERQQDPSREQLFSSHPENPPPPPVYHGGQPSQECSPTVVIINYAVDKNSFPKPLSDCRPLMELNAGGEAFRRPLGYPEFGMSFEGPTPPLDLAKQFATAVIENVLRHAGIRSIEVTPERGNVVNGHRLGWSGRVYRTGISVVLDEVGPKIVVLTLNGDVDSFEIGANGEPWLVGGTSNFRKISAPVKPPQPYQPQPGPLTAPFQPPPPLQTSVNTPNLPFQPQNGPVNPAFQPPTGPASPPFQAEPPSYGNAPNAPFQPPNGPENPPVKGPLAYSPQQEPAAYKISPGEEAKALSTLKEATKENVNGTEIQSQTSNGSPVTVPTVIPKITENAETSQANSTDVKSDKREPSQQSGTSSNGQNGFQQVPLQKLPEQPQQTQVTPQKTPEQSQYPQQFHQPLQYHRQQQPPFAGNSGPMSQKDGSEQPSDRPGMVYSAGVPLNYPRPEQNAKNYNGPPPPAPPSYGFVGPNGPSAQDFSYNSGGPVVQASMAWAGYSQVSPNYQLNGAPNNMEGNSGPVFDGRKNFEGPRGGPVFIRQ